MIALIPVIVADLWFAISLLSTSKEIIPQDILDIESFGHQNCGLMGILIV
jgi:hypothetical protein